MYITPKLDKVSVASPLGFRSDGGVCSHPMPDVSVQLVASKTQHLTRPNVDVDARARALRGASQGSLAHASAPCSTPYLRSNNFFLSLAALLSCPAETPNATEPPYLGN